MNARVRSWLSPILFSWGLWVTVPYVRPLSEWLRAHGILRSTTHGLSAVLLLSFFWVWKVHYRSYSILRLGILLVILSLYAAAMMYYVVAPEERMHFLELSFLAYLYHRALRADGKNLLWQTAGAAGMAGFVGVVEEVIQKFVPSRQFDWRDIFMNLMAAGLAGLAICCVLGPLRPTPDKGP